MKNINEILKNLSREDILANLDIDEHYYGEFGQQFLSNSNVGALIKNPVDFRKPSEPNIHFLNGGAFHTMMLEPEKFEKNYPVFESSSRQTKKYKEAEAEAGEMLLLTHEHNNLLAMEDKLRKNTHTNDLLYGSEEMEYEVPAYAEICGEVWKGKADIVDHSQGLVIDLKTTSDITKFHVSAKRYNYDSQAFIYRSLFGYDMVFLVIDKKTHQIGVYDCSDQFYQTGKEKVVEAVYAYRMYFKNQEEDPFDWTNYLITETL